MSISNKRCCYANSISEFLTEDVSHWLDVMKSTFISTHELPLGESQVRAWRDCFHVLKDQLPPIAEQHPGFDIVFEYVLPYESGRRPDVLLVSQEQVIMTIH